MLLPGARDRLQASSRKEAQKAQESWCSASLAPFRGWCVCSPSCGLSSKILFYEDTPLPANLPGAPSGATAQYQRLWNAENLILATPAEWRAACAIIEDSLRAYKPDPASATVEWSPAHFARIAASLCLRHGDVDRARRIILLGRRIEPDAPQLLFLLRLLERASAG